MHFFRDCKILSKVFCFLCPLGRLGKISLRNQTWQIYLDTIAFTVIDLWIIRNATWINNIWECCLWELRCLTNVYQIYWFFSFYIYSFDHDWRKIETYDGSKTAIQVPSISTLISPLQLLSFRNAPWS